MRRHENDQMSADLEVQRGGGQLGAIVRDVLENVHVKNRIEAVLLAKIGKRANLQPAAIRQQAGVDRSDQPIGERRVGLQS